MTSGFERSVALLMASLALHVQAVEQTFVENDTEKACLDLLQTGLAIAKGKGRNVSRFYSQELSNADDLSYTAKIVVGGQKLDAIMDTGSYELVVFSTQCDSCGTAGENGFDYTKSPSFKQGELQLQQTMQFGSGTALCVDAFDTLQIGPLRVPEQPLWQVQEAEMDILAEADFQALVGLGPTTAMQSFAESQEMSIDKMEAVFDKIGTSVPRRMRAELEQEKQALELMKSLEDSVPANLHVRFLSICLEAAKGAKGHIYWNDESPQARPEFFRKLPVIDPLSWTVPLKNVKLTIPNGTSFDVACKEGCSALLDSGTSLLATSQDHIEKITNIMVSLKANCDKLEESPALEFDLGGMHHVLPPEVLIGYETGMIKVPFKRRSKKPLMKVEQCSLLLMDLGSELEQTGDFWILGMPFFRYYYTTFDFGNGGDDFYDTSLKRSIWTSPADSKCNPMQLAESKLHTAAGAQQMMKNLSPRWVDMPKLRWPRNLASRGMLKGMFNVSYH